MNWSVLEITVPVVAAIVISVLIVFRKPVWSFITTWQEIITLPLSWVLFFFSGYVFYYFDNTAAVFDIGALQLYVFATVGIMWAWGLSWLFIRTGFKTMYNFMQNVFDKSYDDKLTTWERSKYFLWLFSIVFFGFILLVRVL